MSFVCDVTVAEVTKPMIGADLLRQFGLLANIRSSRLMDAETYSSDPASCIRSTIPKLCVPEWKDKFSHVLEEFNEIDMPRGSRYVDGMIK